MQDQVVIRDYPVEVRIDGDSHDFSVDIYLSRSELEDLATQIDMYLVDEAAPDTSSVSGAISALEDISKLLISPEARYRIYHALLDCGYFDLIGIDND